MYSISWYRRCKLISIKFYFLKKKKTKINKSRFYRINILFRFTYSYVHRDIFDVKLRLNKIIITAFYWKILSNSIVRNVVFLGHITQFYCLWQTQLDVSSTSILIVWTSCMWYKMTDILAIVLLISVMAVSAGHTHFQPQLWVTKILSDTLDNYTPDGENAACRRHGLAYREDLRDLKLWATQSKL